MKTLTAALALMLMAPAAFAQGTTTVPDRTPAQAAPAPGAQPGWYTHQGSEMRASKLIGTNVKNDAGETIGSINEVVLDKSGKVAAVVIGVGGFLGIGEREVAVNFGSLRLAQDNSGSTVVSLNATKDALKAAPEWKWAGDKSGTTGMGTQPGSRPAPDRVTR
jgi:sporulation protein YlmC with PRC-barrel domain